MPALAKRIEIDDGDRAELDRIVRSSTAEVRMLERAQIVLGPRKAARRLRSAGWWGAR